MTQSSSRKSRLSISASQYILTNCLCLFSHADNTRPLVAFNFQAKRHSKFCLRSFFFVPTKVHRVQVINDQFCSVLLASYQNNAWKGGCSWIPYHRLVKAYSILVC